MHKNRTAKGIRKQNEIQETYNKWWLNKYILVNKSVKKITRVTYYGNSVYGSVKLELDFIIDYFVSTGSFRPRKGDLDLIKLTETEKLNKESELNKIVGI